MPSVRVIQKQLYKYNFNHFHNVFITTTLELILLRNMPYA